MSQAEPTARPFNDESNQIAPLGVALCGDRISAGWTKSRICSKNWDGSRRDSRHRKSQFTVQNTEQDYRKYYKIAQKWHFRRHFYTFWHAQELSVVKYTDLRRSAPSFPFELISWRKSRNGQNKWDGVEMKGYLHTPLCVMRGCRVFAKIIAFSDDFTVEMLILKIWLLHYSFHPRWVLFFLG